MSILESSKHAALSVGNFFVHGWNLATPVLGKIGNYTVTCLKGFEALLQKSNPVLFTTLMVTNHLGSRVIRSLYSKCHAPDARGHTAGKYLFTATVLFGANLGFAALTHCQLSKVAAAVIAVVSTYLTHDASSHAKKAKEHGLSVIARIKHWHQNRPLLKEHDQAFKNARAAYKSAPELQGHFTAINDAKAAADQHIEDVNIEALDVNVVLDRKDPIKLAKANKQLALKEILDQKAKEGSNIGLITIIENFHKAKIERRRAYQFYKNQQPVAQSSLVTQRTY